MIHGVTGKPGSGKSYFCTRWVYRELVTSSRAIITNVSIDKGRLAELLGKRFKGDSQDILNRLHFIPEEKCRRFWEFPKEVGIDCPCLFILDEAHMFYNSRAWQETGIDVIRFLSQHRKLGHTVVWVTQFPEQIEKQFRLLTQDFTFLRNMAKEKYLGFFRAPRMMIYSVHLTLAPNSVPTETHTVKWDQELADCYDTAAGVTMVGGGAADKNERPPGIPFKWLVVGLCSLLIIVPVGWWLLTKGVVGGSQKYFTSKKPVAVQNQQQYPPPEPPVLKNQSIPQNLPSQEGGSLEPVDEVKIDSVFAYGDIVWCYLSNGQRVRGQANQNTYFCEFEGKIIYKSQ